MTVAPTVDEAGDADVVNAANALPVVDPLTATASTPVVPEPTEVIVLLLGVADVIRPDTLVTTTELPAVFGVAGIVPPAVLSGATPEAFSGVVPTEATESVVIVLRLGGAAGTSNESSELRPSIASVTSVVSVIEIAPGDHEPSVQRNVSSFL